MTVWAAAASANAAWISAEALSAPVFTESETLAVTPRVVPDVAAAMTRPPVPALAEAEAREDGRSLPGHIGALTRAMQDGVTERSAKSSKKAAQMQRRLEQSASKLQDREQQSHRKRDAANHRMATNPAELMNCRQTTNDRKVINKYMACKRRVIRHDHMVAHHAVMRDMGAYHKQAVVPDRRYHPAAFGAGIHGYMFAKDVVRADFQRRRFAMIFHILRLMAD